MVSCYCKGARSTSQARIWGHVAAFGNHFAPVQHLTKLRRSVKMGFPVAREHLTLVWAEPQYPVGKLELPNPEITAVKAKARRVEEAVASDCWLVVVEVRLSQVHIGRPFAGQGFLNALPGQNAIET